MYRVRTRRPGVLPHRPARRTHRRSHRCVAGADRREGTWAGWSYSAAVSYAAARDGRLRARLRIARVAHRRARERPRNPSAPPVPPAIGCCRTPDHRGSPSCACPTLLGDARSRVTLSCRRPMAIALGAEARRETLDNEFANAFISGDVAGTFTDGQSLSGSRTVTALLSRPSCRSPRVSKRSSRRAMTLQRFGGTVNPKFALRWQPVRALVVRGSWGTGFRAPTLPDLFTPVIHGSGHTRIRFGVP